MPHVALQISCLLENIVELKLSGPNYTFYFKFKCTNCGQKSEKFHDFKESRRFCRDTRKPEGFNFLMRCKFCRRENSIDVIKRSNDVYTDKDVGKFKTIVRFECRGMIPVEFSPRAGWVVQAAKEGKLGRVFKRVDLSQEEWFEYDDKNKVSVGITEFESKFLKL